MTPVETMVDRLVKWSRKSLPTEIGWAGVVSSIGQGLDIAWCVWLASRDYSQSGPTAEDVLLEIEMAETSLAFDRAEIANLRATAGIADYWIVDLVSRSIEVRRDPDRGRYRSVETVTGDDPVHPLAAPEITLRPTDLQL